MTTPAAHTSLLTHRFGVNYVPTRSWWYCWNDFDAFAIARDLDAIASLGLDHIRIMLLWPMFQVNPTVVSAIHKERLATLMGLAKERGLDVCVVALNGWLSGYKFDPSFLNGKSIYTAEDIISSEEFYFREIAGVANAFDNFLGFDLGNEINCYQQADIADGDAWMTRLLDVAHQVSPGKVHVNGVDHQPWFREATFSPEALTAAQAIVPLHCWTFFTGALERGDALDRPAVNLLAALAANTRAHASDAAKPIWVQEYGSTQEWMTETEQMKYIERTTLRAIEGGVSWFTWWCSHDIDPMYEFASLEYGLGMMTVDNAVKPYAKVFHEIADAYRGKQVVVPSTVTPPLPSERTDTSTWEWLTAWNEANG